MVKGYMNLFRKAHILEKSPAVILFETIRRLPERLDDKAALDLVEEFVLARDGGYEGLSPPELTDKEHIVLVEHTNSNPLLLLSF